MELTFLRSILLDLRSRFDSKFSSSNVHLKRELLLLSDFEKRLIRKKVLSELIDKIFIKAIYIDINLFINIL